MAETLGWGIIAPGRIAHAFAKGLKASRTGTLVATGSRSRERAQEFANQYGGAAYGSYEEMLQDPKVEAVYIASPHHLHMEHTIACARAGKHILCEKPFTLNLLEAERALAEVDKAGVFFMEAFMYRCHPQIQKLKDLLKEEAIGTVRQVNAEFGFQSARDWENFRTDGSVGGGAVMDVGTYCVSFTRLVAQAEPESASYKIVLNPQGYDESGVGLLQFPNGIMGHFGTAIHLALKNEAWVYGDKGKIQVTSPWFAAQEAQIILHPNEGDPQIFNLGGTREELYAHEADAVADHLDSKEAPYMTKADTLGNMRTLDMLRANANLVFEKETRP